MLVTVNKLMYMAFHRPHSSHMTTTGTFLMELFFIVSNEINLILLTRILSDNTEKHR